MSRTLSALGLAALVAALGALNAHLWQTPIETGPLLPPTSTTERETANVTPLPKSKLHLDDTTPSSFAETTSRPMFWASRRPAPPTVAVIAAPAPPPAAAPTPAPPRVAPVSKVVPEPPSVAFRLAGIVHDGRKGRRALIIWPQLPEGKWVEEGAQIEGWRLAGIDRHAVRIEAAGRSRELRLP